MTQSKYSEADTEAYYDSQDSRYQKVWDLDGSVHWGYFENLNEAKAEDFLAACQRWNEYMFSQSGITKDSRVLDIGCGNGNTAIWLSQNIGCQVVGVDISSVRVENAKIKAQQYPSLKVEFQKASATSLPFEEGRFTHVWSQAVLYHVHDGHQALREIYRVLENGGTFVLDDLFSPIQEINEIAREYVYDRLLFEPGFSLDSYKDFMTELGFMVLVAKDLTEHLYKSYELLAERALSEYPKLSTSYDKTCEAIQANQVGWGFYLCKKQ
ncbi:MAG: methyltransferase domain-containing protein [Cyanobacteria bacterium P01_H01_bin.35]